jgi:LmbE family N-acetylglucosaminyl deacetylase
MSTTRGYPRRVLALGAHPDDIELLCAGTLARFLAAGCAVELAIACRGDRGGASAGPDPELAARRHEEARSAAAILGAPVHFLDFGDAGVWDSAESRQVVLQLLRETRPELILTHGPTDYHADHVRVGELACHCAWFAASAGHATGQPPLDGPPAVFYMDNLGGMGFEPTHLVDVTASFETKRRMLECHGSQLGRPGGLAELAETLARLRGFQAGVDYAEGFRPATLWGRRRAEPVFP